MKKTPLFLVVALMLATATVGIVRAQKTVTFTATINPGVLLADIRNQFGQTITNPTLNLGKITNAAGCRTGPGSLNAKLGNDDNRIYVDNPKAAFDGWTLTISAANGPNSSWGSSDTGAHFDYNDSGAGNNGCSDTDGDGMGGMLSIDSSTATLASDCLTCNTNNILIGSGNTDTFADTPHITLLRANDQSDFLGSWYITDVGVSQTVPPEQDGGRYSIQMILTATAS